MEKTGKFDLRPTSDGRRVYVFLEENPEKIEWTHIEEWNLVAARLLRKMPLKPPPTSIGMKLTRDGNSLFLHEYMVQGVFIWDFRACKFVGFIGTSGGCEAFDVTPDGRVAVTFEGPWENGALMPHKLVLYDTSPYVGSAAKK
jgi:hypothetical protein